MPSSLRLIIAAAVALLLTACVSALPESGGMRYARFLTLDDRADTVVATVLNPWKEGEVLHRYTLPPASHAASGTSLHAYLAYKLGALDRLTGVMDADYVVAPELRTALAEGRLADFGSSMSPNLERIKASACDLIFASPFENAGYGALETLGVPIAECADYMEDIPLGRAEWMRFYGRLLGRAAQADSLFAAEETAYTSLCTPHQEAARPTLLLGKRSSQAWYVAGGESYLGRLVADADVHYVFADEAARGSVPMDFEAVYSRAKDADLWLFTYSAPPAADGTFAPFTYADLAAEDARYAQFRAFREHHVWACNTLALPYYDVLPWSPSELLRDVILVAHPERFPGEKPHYFQPLR